MVWRGCTVALPAPRPSKATAVGINKYSIISEHIIVIELNTILFICDWLWSVCSCIKNKHVNLSSDIYCRTNQEGSMASAASETLDSSRYYCSLCLESVQKLPAAQRHVSRLQSYSLFSSTATMYDHLRVVHEVKLPKVSQWLIWSFLFLLTSTITMQA